MSTARSASLARTAQPMRPAAALALLAWVCAGLALPGTAMAQWKWRDVNGRLHASDLPPPSSIPDKDILQRPGTARQLPAPAAGQASPATPASGPGAAASAAKSPLDQEVERKRQQEQQERAAKARADETQSAARRLDNCSRARAALTTLQSGQRITRSNAQGEREFLDERQRAEETRRVQDIIASDCR